MTVEIIANAFKLFVLTISYALDLARQKQLAIDSANARRDLFEKAASLALERMRAATVSEKTTVDEADSSIDEEAKKPR